MQVLKDVSIRFMLTLQLLLWLPRTLPRTISNPLSQELRLLPSPSSPSSVLQEFEHMKDVKTRRLRATAKSSPVGKQRQSPLLMEVPLRLDRDPALLGSFPSTDEIDGRVGLDHEAGDLGKGSKASNGMTRWFSGIGLSLRSLVMPSAILERNLPGACRYSERQHQLRHRFPKGLHRDGGLAMDDYGDVSCCSTYQRHPKENPQHPHPHPQCLDHWSEMDLDESVSWDPRKGLGQHWSECYRARHLYLEKNDWEL